MENSITSPVSGMVKKVNFKDGESVQKGDVMLVVG
jgi:pyruvate carboxylase subunit B